MWRSSARRESPATWEGRRPNRRSSSPSVCPRAGRRRRRKGAAIAARSMRASTPTHRACRGGLYIRPWQSRFCQCLPGRIYNAPLHLVSEAHRICGSMRLSTPTPPGRRRNSRDSARWSWDLRGFPWPRFEMQFPKRASSPAWQRTGRFRPQRSRGARSRRFWPQRSAGR